MTPLERRSGLSLEEFRRDYAERGKPVILTDVTEGWKALKWTPEQLARIAPEARVQTVPTSATSERQNVEMTLADYADYLSSPDERKLYMINWVFEEDYPQLLADFQIPIYFREDWLREIEDPPRLMWIFMGPGDSGLFMHVDVAHTSAWNAQLTGNKAWKLWPPHQEPYLYAGKVNAFTPNLDQFPKFSEARCLEGEVKAGECIYVPPRWWHQTKNIDPGIALTANYCDRANIHEVLAYLKEHRGYERIYRQLKRLVRRKQRGK